MMCSQKLRWYFLSWLIRALEGDRTQVNEPNEDLVQIFLEAVRNRASRKHLQSKSSMPDDNSPRHAQLRKELDELQQERERLRAHLEALGENPSDYTTEESSTDEEEVRV